MVQNGRRSWWMGLAMVAGAAVLAAGAPGLAGGPLQKAERMPDPVQKSAWQGPVQKAAVEWCAPVPCCAPRTRAPLFDRCCCGAIKCASHDHCVRCRVAARRAARCAPSACSMPVAMMGPVQKSAMQKSMVHSRAVQKGMVQQDWLQKGPVQKGDMSSVEAGPIVEVPAPAPVVEAPPAPVVIPPPPVVEAPPAPTPPPVVEAPPAPVPPAPAPAVEAPPAPVLEPPAAPPAPAAAEVSKPKVQGKKKIAEKVRAAQ